MGRAERDRERRNPRSSPSTAASGRCARAILAVSAKCGAGASSTGGMHISPAIVEPVGLAAALEEGVGLLRQHAGLLRLGAGIDLHEQRGCRPCLAISLASASHRLGRSTEWIASNSATASFALLDCSGPIRCSSIPGCAPRSAGHFALASCTRFSPNTRWPAAITGSIASAPKVFDTAISVTEAGSRLASARRRDLATDGGKPLGCIRMVRGDNRRQTPTPIPSTWTIEARCLKRNLTSKREAMNVLAASVRDQVIRVDVIAGDSAFPPVTR